MSVPVVDGMEQGDNTPRSEWDVYNGTDAFPDQLSALALEWRRNAKVQEPEHWAELSLKW